MEGLYDFLNCEEKEGAKAVLKRKGNQAKI